ncbi:Serine/threonine-protein kinase PknE [Planctomycetes bacterium Poly30]|uniref:non-specific serine/threonine protein kinase n=1 Tax=Saltatorellus ferox TaxID=2528018 RepID=A0A518EWU3_9BACT|nr:Serine/threonine-protein kinase PknE [Planctomycetes bacterium Poly30]
MRQVVRWTIQIGEGLEAAHAAKVIHRDIKPSNIMLRADGEAVLLDFGIAALDTEDDLTRTGASVGTPRYMAPEVLGERMPWKPGLDVYGLSATLYHLLAMRAPFDGTHSKVLRALSTREVPPLASVRSGLPRDLVAIVEHGVERDPKRRYQSASELVEDLKAFLDHRPVSARPVTRTMRLLRQARHSRTVQGAVAATVLFVLGTTGFLVKQASDARAVERGRMAWQHVPASLDFVRPISREITDDARRASVMRKLDALIESPVDPIPARMLRAAFVLDQGDRAAAARDMAWIADETETPLAVELAKRFQAIADDAEAPPAISFEDLPEPRTAKDHYLLGFTLQRVDQGGPAYEQFSSDELQDVRHAREISLMLEALPVKRMKRDTQEQRDDLFRAADVILAKAEELDNEFGGPSAMSLHIRTLMLLNQELYSATISAARKGLALADETHPTLENAGLASHRIGDADLAGMFLGEAALRAPGNTTIWEYRIRAELLAGNHEAARALLSRPPEPPTSTLSRTSLVLAALIDIDGALRPSEVGREDTSLRLASRGLAHLQELPPDSREARSTEVQSLKAIAEAISEDNADGIISALFHMLKGNALHPGRVEDLAHHLPDDLNSAATTSLRKWLDAMALELRRRTGSSGVASLPQTSALSVEPDTHE